MSVRLLRQAILARLQAIPNLRTYDGEVPDSPPVDPDGRVHPYAVLYPTAGMRRDSALNTRQDHLDWGFQVTVAGGDAQRATWAVDAVLASLLDHRPAVAGLSTGPIRLAGDLGPLRRDDEVHPPRHYLPLSLTVTAVSTT